MARKQEGGRANRRGEGRHKGEDMKDPCSGMRNTTYQGRVRYDNHPRKYNIMPPRDRTLLPMREMRYMPNMPPAKMIHEINEGETIIINLPFSAILEATRGVPGFYTSRNVTEEIRGALSGTICRYHNKYGHSTDRCRNLRALIDKVIKEGKLREFVMKERTDQRPVNDDRGARNSRDKEGGGSLG